MNKSRLWLHCFDTGVAHIELSWANRVVWNELHNPAYARKMTRNHISDVQVRLA